MQFAGDTMIPLMVEQLMGPAENGQDSLELILGTWAQLADLHYAIQIAMGWSDSYLHRFHIQFHLVAAERSVLLLEPACFIVPKPHS